MQYVLYLKNLLHGNLGISEQSHRPVRADLAEYVPATIELALFAIVLSLVIGIGLGIVAALFRDRWPDHLIRVLSLAGVSMPVFWIALVAFYLLFFKLGWLPGGGRLDPTQTAPHAPDRDVHRRRRWCTGSGRCSGARCGTCCCPGWCWPSSRSAC